MYIAVINRSQAKRNPLEEDVYTFLMDINKMAVHENDLEDFKTHIKDKISQLNKKHTDCNPIKVGWNVHNSDEDLYLTGVYFTTLNLYKTKRQFRQYFK